MAISVSRLKNLTALRAAAYIFMLAVCAKGVFFYASHHPQKEELLPVQGLVSAVSLGGQGNATSLQVESEHGTQRYSSYYGKVWPGMERIQTGDSVYLLVERDKTNKNELFAGKRYYIWELTHQGQIMISYEEVRDMVRNMEAAADRYIDLWLAISFVLLFIAYTRKIVLTMKR